MVYFIIVTYNGIAWIEKCLNSLQFCDTDYKTIVIDNGSNDGTQKVISQFPDVIFIQSEENLGFGKANNIGIAKAIREGAEYLFLLNQDAYLYKGSVKKVIELFAKDETIGIISPIHYTGNGKNLDISFYEYAKQANTPELMGDLLQNDYKDLYKTNFVNAAAWIVKRSAYEKIGLFHPIFDHYSEDVEYVYRMQENNLEIYISPYLSVIHDRTDSGKVKFFNPYLTIYRMFLMSFLGFGGFSYFSIFVRFIFYFFANVFTFKFKNAYLLVFYYVKSLKSLYKLKTNQYKLAIEDY